MFGQVSGELRHQISMAATGVASFLVLVYVGSGGAPFWHQAEGTPLPSLGGGVVSGVFVAVAASAAVVSWHRHAGARTGWIVATGALVAAQSLVVTLLALESPSLRSPLALGAMLLVALVGLFVVVRPLLRLHVADHVVDDGFAIGLGMGLVAAGQLLMQLPLDRPPSRPGELVIGIVLATHLAATALVLRQRVLTRHLAWLLLATLVAVDVGQLVHAGGFDSTAWVVAATVARAAAGAACLSIAWVTLMRSVEEDRRRINTFEHALVSTTRDQRERLHELRSTVAGLISGSDMIQRQDVSPEMRDRLWRSVRRELARMDRLLSNQDEHATDVDLDEALGLILDLQRLKGRHVEFRSNGDVVRARFDALAEVVNILMDNAAAHGGSDSSLVEVVRRDDERVDIKVTDFGSGIPQEQRTTIFDWGRRGTSSRGEGIGLNMAQRLMSEDGGSLRLVEDQGVGSSFVITLPAVRRSSENDAGREG